MARLPIPGSDSGTWGTILNDYLSQAHNADGTLAPGAVGAAVLAASSVTASKLNTGTGTNGQALILDSTAPGGFRWATVAGGGDPTMGGDLSGTASNAQLVAGAVGTSELANSAVTDAKVASGIAQSKITNLSTDLAAKANTTDVVTLTGAQTVAGVKTFSSSPVVPTPTSGGQAATKGYVDGAVTGASSRYTVVTTTSNYTASHYNAIAADTSAGSFTITLPSPVSGSSVRVRRYDSTPNPTFRFLTIAAPSGVQIDNMTSTNITNVGFPADTLYFGSDGTKWYRV